VGVKRGVVGAINLVANDYVVAKATRGVTGLASLQDSAVSHRANPLLANHIFTVVVTSATSNGVRSPAEARGRTKIFAVPAVERPYNL